jgi:CRISPR system Cascade subunit CasA
LLEVGLRQLFSEAAGLRRIVDASPPVTAAVYRLTFAIMNRALQVQDTEEWEDAWDDSSFAGPVLDYLEAHRSRFDLFSADAPFGQVRGMPENCRLFPWTKLALELPPNSSKLLFDHTDTQVPPLCSPANAARNLLASMAFTVGAGRSCTGQTANAPLTAAMVVIPEGRNLQETLLANLQPVREGDLPTWERPALTVEELTGAAGRVWEGPAERLTWPSRGIELLPEDNTGNVRWIRFGMGWKPPDIAMDRDPWVSYHNNEKGSRFPLKLNPARMVWRDFHAMLAGSSDGQKERVIALSRLALLADAERNPPSSWTVLIAALSADKASIKAWRQERWRVPASIVADHSALSALGWFTRVAEETGESIRKTVWVLMQDLLGGSETADRSQVTEAATRAPILAAYWSGLEARFQEVLELLGSSSDAAEQEWNDAIIDSVRLARTTAFSIVGRDGQALRAWMKASQKFDRLIGKLHKLPVTTANREEEEVDALRQ